ncbi:alpha/beta hydrolase [Pontibacter sp. SGAir0037]|uniref:alpha/beta hydrolase n=1 Tax=Pontibacter sp. SGAir0037 TaxID=2571030 RepID=UPI0010CCFF7F|nr:alpha/beta hydrolase [Pontibacter sp. SGAir0037]QCR23356.1 alpha/beta hydrolase [Pontibacter sp. SGAir0037]
MATEAKSRRSTIYFVSGLGADWRAFQFLRLPPDQPYQHVPWIAPDSINEPLQEYARRLAVQITDPNPILIGLSFGGVTAIELAKILHPKKVILISSLSTSRALPWYYRLMGLLRMHRYTPMSLLRSLHPIAPLLFGARSDYEKKLLKEYILTTNETYLRWALGQLLNWKQATVWPGLVHIHGTADRILPLRDRPDIIKIKGGEHLMITHRFDEINVILNRILEEIQQV